MSAEVGSVLVGLAAIITALAAWDARRSRKALIASTPKAVLSALDQTLLAYKMMVERHAKERVGMDTALQRERGRADQAELALAETRARVASLEVEVHELTQRLDRIASSF